jgi:hypothetical protein
LFRKDYASVIADVPVHTIIKERTKANTTLVSVKADNSEEKSGGFCHLFVIFSYYGACLELLYEA